MMDIEIKERGSTLVEARGFVLERGEDDWILYPEPALQSCCRRGPLRKGMELTGDIPKAYKGQCVTLQGHLEGNLLNVRFFEASDFSLFGWVLLFLCGCGISLFRYR